MKILYVGVYGEGQTSKMRGEILRKLTNSSTFEIIDIEIPISNYQRIFRSLAFRFKIGPVIRAVNEYILNKLDKSYDLIWVDKAIYITELTTKVLRRKTNLLIHYTPDPAFLYHRSKLFIKSLIHYDFAVTTKSFEYNTYVKILDASKVILTTQGYDPKIHKPYHDFELKKGVSFIGHYTSDRQKIIQLLLDSGISVTLAGIHWKKFVTKNRSNSKLNYLGTGLYSAEYAKVISASQFGLGLLSKIIPEKHTTRTFEIPACGTVLITEDNSEIRSYFSSDEVIYFNQIEQIPELIIQHQNNPGETKVKIKRSMQKISQLQVDYESILRNVLDRANITLNS